MKYSQLFIKTDRNATGETAAHTWLQKTGLIHKVSPGIFTYHNLLLMSIRKLEKLIRDELASIGYNEILMPMVQPRQLWEETNRWERMGENLLKFQNRMKQDYCLAGTHEEAVTDLVRSRAKSSKDYPIRLFQIQTKYRDEIRPRYGLLRGREFIMKDAYSFSATADEAMTMYQDMVACYHRIFQQLEIAYVAVAADAGSIGGKLTHEFQMLAEIGDDLLVNCECGYTANKEIVAGDNCSQCGAKIVWQRGIELGHCFLLGTEYSEKMKLQFAQAETREVDGVMKAVQVNKLVEMGCYGIGVSRIMQAVFEQRHDSKGLIFPKKLSPFDVYLANIPNKEENEGVLRYTRELYEKLKAAGISVLWDDRDVNTGTKLSDMEALGFPYQIITSSKLKAVNLYEFGLRQDNVRSQHSLEQIIKQIKEET